MSGRFSKQAAPFLQNRYLNSVSDAVAGGAVTAVPSGLAVSQFQQNLPGDRIILSPVDAFALSNSNVGLLYNGTYRYVQASGNSTASPVRARAAFWDPTAGGVYSGNNIGTYQADARYVVTPDGNAANYTNSLFAGVFLNNFGAGNFGWVQESGKATVKFVNTLTSNNANIAPGSPVFLPVTPAANNNVADNGAFDVLVGGNSALIFQANSTTAYTTLGLLIQNYVGIVESASNNNNTGVVNIDFRAFRW